MALRALGMRSRRVNRTRSNQTKENLEKRRKSSTPSDGEQPFQKPSQHTVFQNGNKNQHRREADVNWHANWSVKVTTLPDWRRSLEKSVKPEKMDPPSIYSHTEVVSGEKRSGMSHMGQS
ncbi:hypothetical protein OG21DRAFT_1491169 [Imleria badia]|nr:hypothetical protein OG21DRAFT_1491169 [Imleria badia]